MNSCRKCKHYKKDERTRLIVCEFGLHESYCEKDKEDFAIEELEKIKAEIETYRNCLIPYANDENYYCKGRIFSYDVASALLEKRIGELKGEQMSDIEKAKEHIKNLANDYKCWDNTISFEEALALNEALQNPCKACDYFADDIISYCRKSEVEGD